MLSQQTRQLREEVVFVDQLVWMLEFRFGGFIALGKQLQAALECLDRLYGIVAPPLNCGQMLVERRGSGIFFQAVLKDLLSLDQAVLVDLLVVFGDRRSGRLRENRIGHLEVNFGFAII